MTFLDERLQLVAGAATPLSAIVQAYVSWCALRDAPPLPETVLLEDLDRFAAWVRSFNRKRAPVSCCSMWC